MANVAEPGLSVMKVSTVPPRCGRAVVIVSDPECSRPPRGPQKPTRSEATWA